MCRFDINVFEAILMELKFFNEGVGSNGKMVTVAYIDAAAGKGVAGCSASYVVARFNKLSLQACLG